MTLERKLNGHEELRQAHAELEVETENLRQQVVSMQQRQLPEGTLTRLKEAERKEVTMLDDICQLKSR